MTINDRKGNIYQFPSQYQQNFKYKPQEITQKIHGHTHTHTHTHTYIYTCTHA
jgi:hypothetical protein